jgi:hypothetical protein
MFLRPVGANWAISVNGSSGLLCAAAIPLELRYTTLHCGFCGENETFVTSVLPAHSLGQREQTDGF